MTEIKTKHIPLPESDFTRNFTRKYMAHLPRDIASNKGMNYNAYQNHMMNSRDFRDVWLNFLPILPSAVKAYIEVATHRDWLLIGNKQAVNFAYNLLETSILEDEYGLFYYGFDNILARMAMDYITVGRVTLHAPFISKDSDARRVIQYIDPTFLTPQKIPDEGSVSLENSGTQTVWEYHSNTDDTYHFDQKEIVFIDDTRYGRKGLPIPRIMYLVPSATQMYYLKQHDTATLDGTKVKDVIVTADDGMVDAVENALKIAVQNMTYSHGYTNSVPVVAINPSGLMGIQNWKIEDMFGRLGVSEVPDGYDREKIVLDFISEVSSVLGLSIRYFWHDWKGGTKSGEQVGQERQSKHGPGFFIKNLTRVINKSGILRRSPSSQVRMAFREESDSNTIERNSRTLNNYAKGFETLVSITGDIISPESIVHFLQKSGVLGDIGVNGSHITIEEDSLFRNIDYDLVEIYDSLENGEVIMTKDGETIERKKTF